MRTQPHSSRHSTRFQRFLRLSHSAHAARRHALNGILAIHQRQLQRFYDLNRVAIGLNPHGNAPMRLFKIFEDQLAAAGPIKGEDDQSQTGEARRRDRAQLVQAYGSESIVSPPSVDRSLLHLTR